MTAVGQILAGRYDLLELLGTGGMGAVYRARDRELDELVALKVIRGELAADPAIVERFRSEVKLARRVTHQNVARTFELGNADGVMFCTMELVDGESLTQRLRQHRRFTVTEAVAIACALCDGLAAAHEANVIHRDIKPDNVLIAGDGRVVLADFGVASMRAAGGELSGTPAYMAPEQARGEPPTPAVDVYSVGVVLHELVTGRRAFTGSTVSILAEKLELERVVPAPGEVAPELAEVIGQATARDLAARIPSARALRRALEPWARPARAATVPQPHAPDLGDMLNVVLIEPRGDDARIHLARAVHEGVATRLGMQPGIRILLRAEDPGEPDSVVVAFEAGETLAIAVSGAASFTFDVPLAVDVVDAAAAALAMAILGAARTGVRQTAPGLHGEANELVLRARYLIATGIDRLDEVVALLRRARELAPDDARIAAALANAHVRAAFFTPASQLGTLDEAAALARAALRAAPDLAESHMAAGHVELHTGDPAMAAQHFRKAIARSPHTGEGHEYLGRMLLEAGFVELGLARIEDAVAAAPASPASLRARWDIVRALALEGRWDDHDRLIAELVAQGGDRPLLLRARFGCWRGDFGPMRTLRSAPERIGLFERGITDALIASFVDDDWANQREILVRFGLAPVPNRRRRALAAQLAAEAAGFAHDLETCTSLIEHATDQGLFDLHWVDRCPLLEPARGTAAFTKQRGRVQRRAEAILDAFYGDQPLATSETAIAPSIVR